MNKLNNDQIIAEAFLNSVEAGDWDMHQETEDENINYAVCEICFNSDKFLDNFHTYVLGYMSAHDDAAREMFARRMAESAAAAMDDTMRFNNRNNLDRHVEAVEDSIH